KYGAPYVTFGVFFCINYIVPYFMWPYQQDALSSTVMLWIRLIGALCCVLLAAREKWYALLEYLLPTLWHFTVMYCLPFTATVMFCITHGSTEWLINVALTITLLIVLVDWLSFVILSILGIVLGFLFYYLVIGPIDIQLSFKTGHILFYQGFFATLIGLLFMRRRQRSFDKLTQKHQQLSGAHQEVNEELLRASVEQVRLVHILRKSGVDRISKVLKAVKEVFLQLKPDDVHAATKEGLEKVQKMLEPMTISVEQITNRATDYLRLSVKSITVNELLEDLGNQLRARGLQRHVYFKVHTQRQELSCDPVQVGKVLFNAISILRKDLEDHVSVYLHIQDTKLSYPLHFSAEIPDKRVTALGFTCTLNPQPTPLEDKYECDLNGELPPMPQNVEEVMLMVSRRIIRAHYGHIELPEGSDSKEHVYVVPVAVREVRPKDMDRAYMELGAEQTRANDQYPGAKEREQRFLQAIRERASANIQRVEAAIELIKCCHGSVNRKSGEPFYLHPIEVAEIVLDYNADEAAIIAALLHDTVEDTPLMLEQVEALYDEEVAHIVDGVTHLESYEGCFHRVTLSDHDNMCMILGVDDNRIIYVKVADRIHNMRTIEAKPYTNQQRTAQETLSFHVPLARSVGLHGAANELHARSVAILKKEK
ncbi:MAG: HD domain-containing protein, partial [Bacteroidota bacterium]